MNSWRQSQPLEHPQAQLSQLLTSLTLKKEPLLWSSLVLKSNNQKQKKVRGSLKIILMFSSILFSIHFISYFIVGFEGALTLNQNYTDDLADSNSTAFQEQQAKFCAVIAALFAKSNVSGTFQGCKVTKFE